LSGETGHQEGEKKGKRTLTPGLRFLKRERNAAPEKERIRERREVKGTWECAASPRWCSRSLEKKCAVTGKKKGGGGGEKRRMLFTAVGNGRQRQKKKKPHSSVGKGGYLTPQKGGKGKEVSS